MKMKKTIILINNNQLKIKIKANHKCQEVQQIKTSSVKKIKFKYLENFRFKIIKRKIM